MCVSGTPEQATHTFLNKKNKKQFFAAADFLDSVAEGW
jgi:hypothetical protein